MTHIFLIGFMGTGKSTVARELAKTLGWPQIELDQEIEKHAAMDIPRIFSELGEEAFRELETQRLLYTAQGQNGVVSCGGGVVLRPENIKYMQEAGTLVLLTASPETVLQRVKGKGNRPLITDHITLEGIQEMMGERQELYQQAAELVVSTDGKSPQEIAREILARL